MKQILAIAFALFATQTFAATSNVPKYFPEFWNDDYSIQSSNNCFNYSTNRVTNSFAQPGESGGASFSLTCESVIEALTHDEGIEPTEFFEFGTKTDDSLIALVVAPDWDFHWFRRGDDGMWTHKPGSLAARNTDDSDQLIPDVEKADRGSYTDFCGYYRIKNYIYDSHEQDGGHVRIGNLKSIPDEPQEGSFTILKYSGRRNPTYNLANVLKQHPELAKQLMGVAANLKFAGVASESHKGEMSKLGHGNGIMIHDTQGLIFPKGTAIQILNDKVLVYQPFVSQYLKLKNAVALPPNF